MTGAATKAKSFVLSQIARESSGPGALIANSNRISVLASPTEPTANNLHSISIKDN